MTFASSKLRRALLLTSLASTACPVGGFVFKNRPSAVSSGAVVVDDSTNAVGPTHTWSSSPNVASATSTTTATTTTTTTTTLFFEKRPSGDDDSSENNNNNNKKRRSSSSTHHHHHSKSKKDDNDEKMTTSLTTPSSWTSSLTEQCKYLTGDGLKRLREDLDTFRENLQWAEAMDDFDRMEELTRAIQQGEDLDPEIVYTRKMEEIAQLKGRSDLSTETKEAQLQDLQKEAQQARSLLPQFQLEGLWVGNYGRHGQQLINVTYSGDTLVATKTTGDICIPRNQVSFTSNLSPNFSSSKNNATLLSPLRVSTVAFPRYAGQGNVAKPGFADSKFVDGQLILMDHTFSFVWTPTRHHVVFRRPKPEQTIALLRNVLSQEDELENMREHLNRCLDMDVTDSLARFHAARGNPAEPFRRIASQQDLEAWSVEQQRRLDQQKQQQKDKNNALLRTLSSSAAEEIVGSIQPFKFMQVNKWKKYIDNVLGGSSVDENRNCYE